MSDSIVVIEYRAGAISVVDANVELEESPVTQSASPATNVGNNLAGNN